MTLLIVDDEYYLVQGLKNRIDWAECGIDTVLEAYSAKQAYEILETEQVDILLADVEMPRENGLSLIRRVNEEGYDCINILLTGHADFNYAKEALQLKIFDYLLKPIEPAQLLLVITRAKEELARRRKETEHRIRSQKEIFWQHLYSGELPPNEDAVEEYLAEAGLTDISVDENYYYSYLLVRKAGSSRDDTSPEAAPAMQESVRRLLPGDSCIAAADRRGYMICTKVVPEVTEETLRQGAQDAVRALEKDHPGQYFVLYTFSAAPLMAAMYAYELLVQYAERIVASGSGVVDILSLQGAGENTRSAEREASVIPTETWREWLLQGRVDDILFQLKGLLDRKNTVYSESYLSNIFYGLLDSVIGVLSEQRLSPGEMLSRVPYKAEFAQATRSPELLLRAAENVLRTADVCLREEKEAGTMMEQVREYIDEHLGDPELSRRSIAAKVHISPDYLSYLFHKDAGCNLSAYITEKRIAGAKKLLLSTDLTLDQIGEQMGFSNSTYFHRQFKKVTGVTPGAYRRQYK